MFPKEIQDQIYKPSEGESYFSEVTVERPAGKMASSEDEMTETIEPDSENTIDLGSITVE